MPLKLCQHKQLKQFRHRWIRVEVSEVLLTVLQRELGLLVGYLSAWMGLRFAYQIDSFSVLAIWMMIFFILIYLDLSLEGWIQSFIARLVFLLTGITCVLGLGFFRYSVFKVFDRTFILLHQLDPFLNWVWFGAGIGLSNTVGRLLGQIRSPKPLKYESKYIFRSLPVVLILAILFKTWGCWASSPGLSTHIFAELLKGEVPFKERLSEISLGHQSISFLSRGLPEECQSSSQVSNEVWVTVISEGGSAVIQVIGTRPRKFSSACIYTLYSLIKKGEEEGIKMVSNNLNRMESGRHLYLEFFVEERLIGANIRKLLDVQGLRLYSKRHEAEVWVLLVICIFGLIFATHLMFRKKRA